MNILQDDENFLVAVVEYRGRSALLKRIQPNALEQRRQIFANEQLGMRQFKKLAEAHPEWGLVVPNIYEASESEVMREFIKGEELFNDTLETEEAVKRLHSLALLLARIDTVKPELAHDDAMNNSAPYKNIRRRFEVWSRGPLEAGLLGMDDFAAANALIEEYEAQLEPRYAHGDMSPYKHIFILDNDQLGLIDFEHYSPYKPRFYDICYAYTRLFTLVSSTMFAKEMLRDFLDKAENISEPQLLAVMTQRAIGMHFDALNDFKKGSDYRDRAKQLLLLCLRRDINALLQ